MTNHKQEEAITETIILANANIARKARVFADRNIDTAIKESGSSKKDFRIMIDFAEMFMEGKDQKTIFAELGVSKEIQDQILSLGALSW